jgi:hypothetical protein
MTDGIEPTRAEAVELAQHGIEILTRILTEPGLKVEDFAGPTLDDAQHAAGGLAAVAVQLLQLWSLMKGVEPSQALSEYALVIAEKERDAGD